jgi:hypothetical protein
MSIASENTITMHDKHEATTAAMKTTSASSDKHRAHVGCDEHHHHQLSVGCLGWR